MYVYYGQPTSSHPFSNHPDKILTCSQKYCNIGFSLDGTDVNQDGYLDLIIGAPFAPAGGKQRGLVAIVLASKLPKAVFIKSKQGIT